MVWFEQRSTVSLGCKKPRLGQPRGLPNPWIPQFQLSSKPVTFTSAVITAECDVQRKGQKWCVISIFEESFKSLSWDIWNL